MAKPIHAFPHFALSDASVQRNESSIQKIGMGPDTLAVISGLPNVSKTTLAVDMGCHVSAGAPWFGLKLRRSPVAYVAAEAAGSVTLRACATSMAKFEGQRLPLYIIPHAPALGSPNNSIRERDVCRLIATIREIEANEGEPVRLIVVDTLASCLSGSEENGSGMTALVASAQRIARECSACVTLLHHPAKAGDGKGLRGHGSLLGAADTVIEIEADEASGIRTATLRKSRDAAVGLQLAYRLQVIKFEEQDEWDEPVSTVVIEPTTDRAPSRTNKLKGANQLRAATALREWSREHARSEVISSAEMTQLLRNQNIDRRRQPEVLESLVNTGALTRSVNGFQLHAEMLP